MKKIIITILVWLGFVVSAQAADKKIEVTFTYESPAKEFRLYMDGQKVCSTLSSASTTKMDCLNIPIVYGIHMFTMTAVSLENIESTHSPAYAWTYAPISGVPPTFINFTIVVDGKPVTVGPLEVVK